MSRPPRAHNAAPVRARLRSRTRRRRLRRSVGAGPCRPWPANGSPRPPAGPGGLPPSAASCRPPLRHRPPPRPRPHPALARWRGTASLAGGARARTGARVSEHRGAPRGLGKHRTAERSVNPSCAARGASELRPPSSWRSEGSRSSSAALGGSAEYREDRGPVERDGARNSRARRRREDQHEPMGSVQSALTTRRRVPARNASAAACHPPPAEKGEPGGQSSGRAAPARGERCARRQAKWGGAQPAPCFPTRRCPGGARRPAR